MANPQLYPFCTLMTYLPWKAYKTNQGEKQTGEWNFLQWFSTWKRWWWWSPVTNQHTSEISPYSIIPSSFHMPTQEHGIQQSPVTAKWLKCGNVCHCQLLIYMHKFDAFIPTLYLLYNHLGIVRGWLNTTFGVFCLRIYPSPTSC